MKTKRIDPIRTTRPAGRRESGVALMISVLLLIAVSALALSTMQTAASDGQVAGFQNQDQISFYAAEAGIAAARRTVRNMGARTELPVYPTDFPDAANRVSLATTSDYQGGGQPAYYADPLVAAPIVYIGEGKRCIEGCNAKIGGQGLTHTKWQVNVVGEAPSGDRKRLEVVATRLLSKGY